MARIRTFYLAFRTIKSNLTKLTLGLSISTISLLSPAIQADELSDCLNQNDEMEYARYSADLNDEIIISFEGVARHEDAPPQCQIDFEALKSNISQSRATCGPAQSDAFGLRRRHLIQSALSECNVPCGYFTPSENFEGEYCWAVFEWLKVTDETPTDGIHPSGIK